MVTLVDLLVRVEASVAGLLGGDADRAERRPTHVGESVERMARFVRAHGGRVRAVGPGAQVHVELPTSKGSRGGT
jgi:hypothetical protein